jgi:PAS domain S-box-containing protein
VTTSIRDAASVFGLAIEASPSGVVVTDSRGTIVLVNRTLENQFGYSRAELVGQVVDLLLPELRDNDTAFRQASLEEPELRPIGAARECRGRRKDGSQIPVEIVSSPIRTPDGLLVLTSTVDVTSRYRAQETERAAIAEHVRAIHRRAFQSIHQPAPRSAGRRDSAGPGGDLQAARSRSELLLQV